MQSTKKLTMVLRDLVGLLDEEAARNPQFATSLENILADLPARPPKSRRPRMPAAAIPDVFSELTAKGEEEFRFWLRTLDLPTLKAIIKLNGFDPAKTSQHWSDPDKFISLVADQTVSRSKRGSAFLPPKGGASQ
jgi:hypothetical protein